MLNPGKRQIQGVLKNETWTNNSILDKYKIFYWEFKIATNISDYTKMVKCLISHTVTSSKNGSTDHRAKSLYRVKVHMTWIFLFS